MSVTTGEDFGGFVAARWADLEAVAVVAVLDPESARETTTAALVALRSRWPSALEEGAPTATARRELVERLARPPRRRGVPPEPSPVLREAADDPDSSVPAVLFDCLAGEPVLVRAAVAARTVWEVRPDDLALLAGRAGADLAAGIAAATHRLLAAHREARATDGLGPADHRLEDDLADLVHRLAGTAPEPPDPSAIVAERSRRVRRRSLLAGGAVAAAAGAAGWAAFGRERGAATAGPAASSTPTPAGPDDPAWATTRRWPPRGALATDFGIQSLMVRKAPGARLLYADEVHGVRVVVATDSSSDGAGAPGTPLRVWSGAAGVPADQLTEVPLGYPGIFEVEDAVALGVPHPTGAVVLALTRPTLDRAEVSPVVRPTPEGEVERDWSPVPLDAGIGAVLLPQPPGPAARVRCGGYDGPLPRPSTWDVQWDPGLTQREAVTADVAAATGIPSGRLDVDVLTAVIPPGPDREAGGPAETTTAELVTVRTPNGAVVRSLLVSTESPGSSSSYGAPPMVVPRDAADAPAVIPLEGDTARPAFVVVVPGPGAAVRLTSPTTGAGSDAVPLTDHGAVVLVPADHDPELRVRVEDSRGRALYYDAVPPPGSWLYDLWDDQF